MAIENIRCVDILSYPVSIVGPTMVEPGEKIFKIKVLKMTGRLSFGNKVFHKRASLVIL